MKKSLIALGTAALIAVGLVGCSSPATTNSSAAPAAGGAPGPAALAKAKGVTEVTLWHGLGGVNGQAFQSLIDEFNDENSGKIHVDAIFQGAYQDILAKYTASLKDKSTPTVILSGDVSSGFLNDVQASESPEEMAAANPKDLKLSDLLGASKNYYSAKGKLLAVPMNMSSPVLWINEDLLRQAGITDYSTLSTLSGVADAAKQIHQKLGIAGIDEPFDDWWTEQLTAASGSLYCTPGNGRTGDGATKISLSAKSQVAALQTMAELYTSGVALNTGIDGGQAVTAFNAGKTAMMLNSSGSAGPISAGAEFTYTALPYPISGDKKTSGTVVGGSAMWLSKNATDAQKVAGWKVISFLASAPSQLKFSQASGYVPVNKSVASMADEKTFLAQHPSAKTAINQVAATPVVPATAGCLSGAMTAVRTAVIPHIQAAFAGSVSLKDALAAATTDANTQIEQYREQAGQ